MRYPLGCLFSGVGRFEAGLSLAGWEAAWQIEANPFRRRVLEQRFGVEVLPDIREATGMPKVRGLAGGFPCQDLSGAGPRIGIKGARSMLWGQFDRIIGECEPEVVFIENVPPLLYRGFDLVVRNLVERGYSVEWDCIPAAAVGAPHLRDRVWIVAERGGTEPRIFGEPASLFPEAPQPMAEGEWRRWPRAGFATDPDAALALQPLAPMAEVKRGLVLWPTPHGIAKEGAARRPGPSGNKLGFAVNEAARGQFPEPPDRWPTPAASMANYNEDPEVWAQRSKHKEEPRESVGLSSLPLGVAVRMWPTPSASDGSGGRNEMGAIDRAVEEGQESLRTLSRPSGAKAAVSLRTAAVAAERGLWPTPRASGAHETGGGEMTTYRRTPSQAAGKHGLYLQAEANEVEIANGGKAGRLNPDWVEALMGMPVGWTDPEVANAELRAASIPVGPTELPPPEEPPRTADNVSSRLERLAACGDSLVAEIPARVASARRMR